MGRKRRIFDRDQLHNHRQQRHRGGRIGYWLSEDATVRITVQRLGRGLKVKTTAAANSCVKSTSASRRRLRRQITKQLKRKGLRGRRLAKALRRELLRARCVLYTDQGVLSRNGKAGTNGESFSGRIGKRLLKAGPYQIVATATDAAGNTSQPKTKRFRIIE